LTVDLGKEKRIGEIPVEEPEELPAEPEPEPKKEPVPA
jgi:hypothetical protein